MKIVILFALIVILSLSVNYHTYAQTEKKINEKQNEKIELLEQKIKELESRISVLEKKLHTKGNQEQSSFVSKGDYKKKENWRALQQGMSKYQVKELLGEPGQISKLSYGGEIWYFPSAIGGSVTFKANSTVDGWSEP